MRILKGCGIVFSHSHPVNASLGPRGLFTFIPRGNEASLYAFGYRYL